MNKRISIINWGISVLLSLVFCFALGLSFFTFPLEMVLFHPQSYKPVLEDELYIKTYPVIISELLVSNLYELYQPNNPPPVFLNTDDFVSVIGKYIPKDLSNLIITDFINEMISFMNFRTTESSLSLDIHELKLAIIPNKRNIAEDYLLTLPNCKGEEEQIFIRENELTIADIPKCKPSSNYVGMIENIISLHLEDQINRLPSTIFIEKLIPVKNIATKPLFFYYSITRWILRLVPFLAISILIVLSVLLKNEKRVMLKWCGYLLIIPSCINLVGLIVLLIGFDQFVIITLGQKLDYLIRDFRILLLEMVRVVGFRTLLWAAITSIFTLIFGFLLNLISKLYKPKVEPEKTVEDANLPEEIKASEEELTASEQLKAIEPETIEEIEKRENQQKPKRKKKES